MFSKKLFEIYSSINNLFPIFSIVFLLALSGCGAAKKNFESWKGVHISDAFAQLGQPSKPPFIKQNAYYWDVEFNININPSAEHYNYNNRHGLSISKSYYQEGYSYKGHCSFLFTTDKVNIIQETKYWGEQCDWIGLHRNTEIKASQEDMLKIEMPSLFQDFTD